jgi:hypothetical protein
LIRVKTIKKTYLQSSKALSNWVLISVMVAGNWLFTFLALTKLGPFVFIFSYFNASALIGAIVEYSRHKSKFNFILILALLSLLIMFYFDDVLKHPGETQFYFYALLAAFFGYGYRRFSVKFSQKTQLNAAEVLSIRFFLLLLIAFCFIHPHDFIQLHWRDELLFFLITTVTFIIPLYCMQKSVLTIGAERFSLLSSCCPAMTAVLMLVTERQVIELTDILLSVMFFFISLATTIRKSVQKTQFDDISDEQRGKLSGWSLLTRNQQVLGRK